MQENPGCVIKIIPVFTTFFRKPGIYIYIYKAIQSQNLISHFAKTGIHPFNPGKISVPIYPPGANDESDEESSDEEEMDVSDEQEGSHDGPSLPHFLFNRLNCSLPGMKMDIH